jgi:hypothetical protein
LGGWSLPPKTLVRISTMAKHSPSDIDACIIKAEYAAKNALCSIERAYLLPQEGAPAAFILLTCFIDFLGTLYAGAKSTGGTFQKFVIDFMSGYDAKGLYEDLRCKLVHNYAIGQRKYVLTHGNHEMHLKSHESHTGKATILNLEDFFDDVKQAERRYFEQVKQDEGLRKNLSKQISRVGTIEDVQIVVSPHGPTLHGAP